MQVDQYGLEVLDAAECRALIRNRRIGRIGTSLGALPVIVPVAYALDGDTIVLRTKLDTRLTKAIVNCVVSFEVDDLDDALFGWGVNVTGEATAVHADHVIARLEQLGVPPLLVESQWIRIPTQLITGRRRVRRGI